MFQHQFADAWDIELEMIQGRYEGIRHGDAAAAATVMRHGHARLIDLARQRVDHPAVRPYLAITADPDDSVIPLRRQPKRLSPILRASRPR
ncbi:MAG: hypothetical protein ABIP77_10510 [Candidatus Limnocylindrales bacterium]